MRNPTDVDDTLALHHHDDLVIPLLNVLSHPPERLQLAEKDGADGSHASAQIPHANGALSAEEVVAHIAA